MNVREFHRILSTTLCFSVCFITVLFCLFLQLLFQLPANTTGVLLRFSPWNSFLPSLCSRQLLLLSTHIPHIKVSACTEESLCLIDRSQKRDKEAGKQRVCRCPATKIDISRDKFAVRLFKASESAKPKPNRRISGTHYSQTEKKKHRFRSVSWNRCGTMRG